MIKFFAALPWLGWVSLGGLLCLSAMEVRGRTMAAWQLLVPPVLATLVSITTFGRSGLLVGAAFLPWLIGLAVGVALGALIGWRARFRVDHQWRIVRLRAGWPGVVAVVVFAVWCVGVSLIVVGGAVALAVPLVVGAGLGAGYFVGRSVALSVRAFRDPHTDIVSAYSVNVM
ncbi:MAG: hypothetical protein FJX02_04375 [Alphaproteobacteria bacterium]|nr:hypothetical protein [Alphaproteobacteria bacterium]